MIKIYKKWENLNIKYKLFSITTALLVALALGIYGMIYFFLPKYYHEYKIEELEKSVNEVVNTAKNNTLSNLEETLYNMAKEQNLAILLRDQDGNVIYGKNEVIFLRYGKYILNSINNEYRIETEIKTADTDNVYTLDILMPLQPVDEANIVIRRMVPFTLIFAVIIGIIGAFIYSNVITKPLISIIEKERQEEENRKEFIATISHELKTPITIISGQLEGMMYNIGKYKDRELYLRKSYETTHELRKLVNEMVQISKSDVISSSFDFKEVRLYDIIKDIIDRQEFLLEEKKLNVSITVNKRAFVFADEDKFGKALYNIINNAIKYSPEGENINIKLIERGFRASILDIENTGVTIDETEIKGVFTPFYRGEKSRSRKTGGSGLGLYLTAQILKKHGFEYKMINRENAVAFIIEMKGIKSHKQ